MFSGIAAPEVAAQWIDWRWCAEVDKFCCALLAYRFPHVPNLGDVTKVDWKNVEPVDVIVFGSPCQSFSVAGRRLGMDDPRGNLALVALAVIAQLRPKWFLFENVPGLLSSAGGEDFGTFLGAVEECGYLGAWRSLDAEYFGLAQRRERVFFVGCPGDWRPAAAVLLERESVQGNPAPSRKAGQSAAPTLNAGPTSGGRTYGTCPDTATGLVSHALNGKGGSGRIDGESETFVACPLTSNPYGDHESRESLLVTHSLRADGFDASEDGTGRGTPLIAETVRSHPRPGSNSIGNVAVAFDTTQITSKLNRSNPKAGDPCHPLAAGAHPPSIAFAGMSHAGSGWAPPSCPTSEDLGLPLDTKRAQSVSTGMAVRRLLPIECEKLQGLPPNWTAIPYRGKPAADGPRYRAIGNSMAVPVIAWILRRIEAATLLGREVTPARSAAREAE